MSDMAAHSGNRNISQKIKDSKTTQIIGEIALCVPIIFISFKLSLGVQVVAIMAFLLIFKQFYGLQYHTPKGKKGKWICFAITYGIISVLLLIVNNFKANPILIMIFCAIATYADYYAGKLQVRLMPSVSAKDKAIAELRDKCFTAGITGRDADMCVDYFINTDLSHQDIADKYGIEWQTSKNRKSEFKKKFK